MFCPKQLGIFGLCVLFASWAWPAFSQTEAEVEVLLCADMETSYRIPVGSVSYLEADCVSDTHAIEIDWNDKWREGVGQALVYSKLLDLKFGLILVCKENSTKEHLCYRHSLSAQQVLSDIEVEGTIWQCVASAQSLNECTRIEVTPSASEQ